MLTDCIRTTAIQTRTFRINSAHVPLGHSTAQTVQDLTFGPQHSDYRRQPCTFLTIAADPTRWRLQIDMTSQLACFLVGFDELLRQIVLSAKIENISPA
ncbi:hypothetical protein TNCT_379281 [Trichonephila clavata]|uniref:Uncharacterized protein n=1 Tax=Trichonephila clavata TaxID=2740835 RepID=A0A8X6IZW9_TRICU|nr:hypothetical protein TNCT_379281 [Trichonephila clavata]